MATTTVAVLFGGRSSEHSISSATAAGVLRAIDRERYRVIPVGITREGAFVLEDDDADKFALNPERMPEVVDNGTRVLWPEPGGPRELRVRRVDGDIDVLGEVDVVLPILHGPHGEDGTIQGFFDTLQLPYAGGGVLDSALCMDKHFMKIVLQAAGIPVAPWVTVDEARWRRDPEGVRSDAAALGIPSFVKPARAGSSVGVSKVHEPGELDAALELAFAEDGKVLIEPAIVGREVEVAVLEGRGGGPARASLPGEIVLTTREFYDFEGKYLGGDGAEVVCPADVTEDEIDALKRMAVAAFAAVDGRGLARVDFFRTPDGLYVNELNTMPGFTPISMFPKCWIASGLSYGDLISELIEIALSRVADRV
ncbi:D-alanine-D-alanine ligase [Microbacterium sp. TS-1]|uniref:D-alanine--D-alanine ligase n=1 Tax=Microbacterium arborescens TaxID=33883 RepID=A0ABX2WGR5_9MICO|nr:MULTISPECIES: D-alanine--D-alanine ligase family protein [Microbacterium]APF33425.1 D-alanine--D-alanine ligase A [Microbacterium paludicola]OAZ39748.1 D-alanine--D-alanine ligase A [Microbacterium arborescens]POX67098.1 D-alanine--D-alanine ligase A [Microbacterium sp. Ru50]QCR40263.1 D-alanine--D-alanine ligase A [Microbacterium sp. SGAir0570]GAD33102.1 D-alanine-D-alanine ligase [Microbacterium sp. TS-1]